MAECLECLHFKWLTFAQFENEPHIFKEKFMEAMQTHNHSMTTKVYVLAHHVPKYVHCTGVPIWSASEQALVSQHAFFDIFLYRFEVNCTKFPVSRKRLLNTVRHHNLYYKAVHIPALIV